MVHDLSTATLVSGYIGFVAGTLLTNYIFSKTKFTLEAACGKVWYISIGFWVAVTMFKW